MPDLDPRELVFGHAGHTFINAACAHTRPGGFRFNGEDRGAWYCGFDVATFSARCPVISPANLKRSGASKTSLTMPRGRSAAAPPFRMIRRSPIPWGRPLRCVCGRNSTEDEARNILRSPLNQAPPEPRTFWHGDHPPFDAFGGFEFAGGAPRTDPRAIDLRFEPAVMGRLNALPATTVFMSAVTGRILYSVALLPEGKRREGWHGPRAPRSRLSFTGGSALQLGSGRGVRCAGCQAQRSHRRMLRLPQSLSRSAALAVCDVPDFEGCGVAATTRPNRSKAGRETVDKNAAGGENCASVPAVAGSLLT